MSNNRLLIIVQNTFEAQRILPYYFTSDDAIILAISLAAEFYLKQKLTNWENPLYGFLDKNGLKSTKYIFPSFEKVYRWTSNTNYQYIRDRFSYFLAELERSVDFAQKVIKKYKPQKIIIGTLGDFAGSTVMVNNLKPHAFYLLAKEKKINIVRIKTLRIESQSKSALPVEIIGQIVRQLRLLKKQQIHKTCDVLIVATPRHLIHLAKIVKKLENRGLVVGCITYNLTLSYKRQLDKLIDNYWEKERLIDGKTKLEAKKLKEDFIKQAIWRNFSVFEFKNRQKIIEFLRSKVKSIVTNEMDEVFLDLVIAKEVFGKLGPRLLLTTTDPDTRALTFINCAKSFGVETACLQHGAFIGSDSPAMYPVSHYFVGWSNLAVENMKKLKHFRKIKIIIGQSPFHRYSKDKIHFKTRGKINILFLTSVHLVDSGLVMSNLKALFETLGKYHYRINLAVRNHPTQFSNLSDYEALRAFSTLNFAFANDGSLESTIEKATLVIWEDTTAGFDAMLAGKPTIYFNPYSGEDFFGVKKHNCSLAILSGEDLEKLESFLENENLWSLYAKRGYDYAQKYLGVTRSGPNRTVKAIFSTLEAA